MDKYASKSLVNDYRIEIISFLAEFDFWPFTMW